MQHPEPGDVLSWAAGDHSLPYVHVRKMRAGRVYNHNHNHNPLPGGLNMNLQRPNLSVKQHLWSLPLGMAGRAW